MRFLPKTSISKYTVATLVAIGLWTAWLASILLGFLNHQNGPYADLEGQPIGADFIQFYAAGLSVIKNQAGYLYDRDFQHALQNEVFRGDLLQGYYFNTPPWVALLFVPLALLPYVISFLFWTVLQGLALYKTLLFLNFEKRFLPFVFSFFPIFTAFSYGQSGILLLFLFTLTHVLIKNQKVFLAGLVASLICYKPQFLSGVVIWWVLCPSKRKAVLGMCIGSATIILFTAFCIPDSLGAYKNHIANQLFHLQELPAFPFAKFHTTSSLFSNLIPIKTIAQIGTFVTYGIGSWYFLKVVKNKIYSNDIKFSAVILFTIIISPYTLIYDLSVLILPAILLYQSEINHILKKLLPLLYCSVSVAILLGVTILNPLQIIYVANWINISELFVLFISLYITRELHLQKL